MADKLWGGSFHKRLDPAADDFNSSIRVDQRMYRQDILGSIAHSSMLASKGIISQEDAAAIRDGLAAIAAEIDSGDLTIDPAAEDIHSFIETELTKRVGDAGKRLHTARSRNDQVALDTRLYIRDRCGETMKELKALIEVICDRAEEHCSSIMPGYTHLQRAQPVTMGHYLMAYAQMFIRDIDRVSDCRRRLNVCPLGSAALAGTDFDIDREMTSDLMKFDGPCANSMDGVSDRDFVMEFSADLAMIMTHLSRFSEELILWSSWEFKFIEMDDSFSTGSSIMPQKKNPDIAELVRGKTGRVYGDLISILTVMKGLPLAYNKDMQEDKEGVFDASDTVLACLRVFAPMLKTMRIIPENMKKAASSGFINATDCADYLTEKGVPFRTAYRITGDIVNYCTQNKKTLEDLTLDEFRSFSDEFDDGIFKAVDLNACAAKRISYGGTAPENVLEQIDGARKLCAGLPV
ncbi:MAG: argininosuccinate lyase [Clostridia bacterium]|nr:argininosuccinate lyase [Clostridia bacterium]